MKRAVTPLRIIRILNEKGIRFVLTGSHAIGGWMQKPRASPSVEFLVHAPQRALRALQVTFPRFLIEKEGVAIRMREPKEQIFFVLLKKPDTPLEKKAFAHTLVVNYRKQAIPFPAIEMAVALSYAPMTLRPWSDPEKYMAAHDFISMLKMNPDIDLEKLGDFGELALPGCRNDILERTRVVQSGEKFVL